MKLLKRWRIHRDLLTEADVAWLTGCCNNLEVTHNTHEFKNLRGSNGSLIEVEDIRILVDTVDDSQESMLKLKYGGTGELQLWRVEHWDERDIQQRIDYYGEYMGRKDEC